mmetsp:Transcript_25117/g.65833  ORF Transcript_25117/g.65833 Transcript_25117/m.65833 type:complete len:105 (+) Transcript_25117:1406-1720(+)
MVKKEPCAVKRLLGLPLKRTSSDHGVARRHRTRDDADWISDGLQLPTCDQVAAGWQRWRRTPGVAPVANVAIGQQSTMCGAQLPPLSASRAQLILAAVVGHPRC